MQALDERNQMRPCEPRNGKFDMYLCIRPPKTPHPSTDTMHDLGRCAQRLSALRSNAPRLSPPTGPTPPPLQYR